MKSVCANCKVQKPETELVEVAGVWLCRDMVGCEYRCQPWKDPARPKVERERLRAEHLRQMKR